MTRLDAEVLCPLCNGGGEGKTFKRMIQLSLDLDLSRPNKLTSQNVCVYCKDPLPVNVIVELAEEPCCDQPLLRGHYDLIPWRKRDERLIHRKCANCGQEILLRERIEIEAGGSRSAT